MSRPLSKSQARAERFETFVTWYLRLNGYFTVPNFVLHAGDDATRISGDVVGQHGEVDTLAVRLPFSREESRIRFPTDERLLQGADGKLDVIVAEVKSGADVPNETWRNPEKVRNIQYLLKFIGCYESNRQIEETAMKLQREFVVNESTQRLRYVVFSHEVNRDWKSRGVDYITFEECIQFIVGDRGPSWYEAGIAHKSQHSQWDNLINSIFSVANAASLDPKMRKAGIRKILDRGPCQPSEFIRLGAGQADRFDR